MKYIFACVVSLSMCGVSIAGDCSNGQCQSTQRPPQVVRKVEFDRRIEVVRRFLKRKIVRRVHIERQRVVRQR